MKSDRYIGRQGRRQHDRAFKEKLVRQSLEPGASVSAISLRNGINANMLFKWRREHLRAGGQRATPNVLVPVEMAPQADFATASAPLVPSRLLQQQPPCSGIIELEIAGVHLRVRGPVDEASLCSVLRALRQTQ